jgi:hypothetical protein
MLRAMRRAMLRRGWTCRSRQGRVPFDYVDRTTEAGPKNGFRGAAGLTSPGYRVMKDGSIRRT